MLAAIPSLLCQHANLRPRAGSACGSAHHQPVPRQLLPPIHPPSSFAHCAQGLDRRLRYSMQPSAPCTMQCCVCCIHSETLQSTMQAAAQAKTLVGTWQGDVNSFVRKQRRKVQRRTPDHIIASQTQKRITQRTECNPAATYVLCSSPPQQLQACHVTILVGVVSCIKFSSFP